MSLRALFEKLSQSEPVNPNLCRQCKRFLLAAFNHSVLSDGGQDFGSRRLTAGYFISEICLPGLLNVLPDWIAAIYAMHGKRSTLGDLTPIAKPA